MVPDASIRCTSALVTLASENLAGVVEFYSQLLGCPAEVYQRDRYAEFGLPGLRLGIFKPRDAQAFAHPAGAMSLCLEVANLEEAIAHLTALGHPPPGPILTASHGREIYAYDPDGNRIILHQGQV